MNIQITRLLNGSMRVEKICFGVLFLFLSILVMRQIGSEDIGFHMKTGEYILSGAGWPKTDPFTYTVLDHPYINPSWGYDVIVALVHKWAGVAGLVIFHGALVLATFYLVLRTARLSSASSTTLAYIFFLGCVAAEIRFYARPELVSYLMLAAVLYVLHSYSIRRTSLLWLLVPIHLLWANLHSLYILGWLAELSFIVGISVRDRKPDVKLILCFAASLAVVFLNPYGWQGVMHIITLATRLEGGQIVRESIGELVSPYALRLSEQYPFYPKNSIFAFRAFSLISILAILPSAIRNKRLELLFLWAISFYLSFKMIRNIPIYVIVNIPMIAWGLSLHNYRFNSARELTLKRASNALLILLCVVTVTIGLRVLNNAHFIDDRRIERVGLGWNHVALPVDATEFIKKLDNRSRMFNDLKFGGYLMWALPDPVFIDGRLEVMGDQFFEQYSRMMGDPNFLEQSIAAYGIGWIMFDYMWNMPLLIQLSNDPRWELSYIDSVSTIFLRKSNLQGSSFIPAKLSPIAGDLSIARLPGVNLTPRPGAALRWMSGVLHQETFPVEDYNIGLFHFSRGEMPQAAGRFIRAIEQSEGRYYEIYYNLGLTLDRLGRYDDARACFKIVLEDDPNNNHARQRVMMN